MESSGIDAKFAGRVVIVTGGSAGLGRAYALELGRLGASVVVNGRGADAVERTVADIRASGGEAIACVADCREGEVIASSALNAYGQIDALISNAGFVRDRSFAKMTLQEWQEVLDVHLTGTFACVKAVWPHMLARKYGRIVLTSSGAGMHGNFGQANYATAKAGLAGLAKTLALEGAKVGIRVNALAPMGLTQMNAEVLTPEAREQLTVNRVAPYAVALCHEAMSDSGLLIEVGGGWAGALRWQRAAGLFLDDTALSTDAVLRRWSNVTAFDENADYPRTTLDSLQAALDGASRISG